MGFLIEDGTGGGYKAKVNEHNELLVMAESVDNLERGSSFGYTFRANTGALTLNVGTSAVFYMKNSETQKMAIREILVHSGTSTVAGNVVVTIIRNPTGGTITSAPGGTITPQNMNFGSGKAMTSTGTLIYYGADTKTLTGGTTFTTVIGQDKQQIKIEDAFIILEPNSAIGINVTTLGTQAVACTVIFHFPDDY